MSHFTVLVKVDKDRLEKHEGDLESAVGEMLAPYQENNMGDCPKEFMEFHDVTDEVKEDWEDKEVECVRLPDGEVVFAWDRRFKKPKMVQNADGEMVEHPFDEVTFIPDEYEQVKLPMKEVYDSFEAYVDEWHGYKFDEEQQAYGYWENPNKKWDWYQIGGRWRGLLRVKEMADAAYGERSLVATSCAQENGDPNGYLTDQPHEADIAMVKDIDFEGMDLEVDGKIEEWWKEYEVYKKVQAGELTYEEAGEDFRWVSFNMPRTLQNLGVIRCIEKRKPMEDENGEPILDEDGRQKWTDGVFEESELTLEEVKEKYRWNWEFGTWAVLDNDGWHEKGEMGWWGFSTATPESRAEFHGTFMEKFVKNEDPETTLVCVDCHI